MIDSTIYPCGCVNDQCHKKLNQLQKGYFCRKGTIWDGAKIGDTIRIRLPKYYTVKQDYKDNKQMTRAEAVEKIRMFYADPDRMINAVEALGLIKFDEVKDKTIEEIIDIFQSDYTKSGEGIINQLKQSGYLIVKKNRNAVVKINQVDSYNHKVIVVNFEGVLLEIKQD